VFHGTLNLTQSTNLRRPFTFLKKWYSDIIFIIIMFTVTESYKKPDAIVEDDAE